MTTFTTKSHGNTIKAEVFRQKILCWYDRHRRVLPWRALPDTPANPYHVWLSEIMLQQTTVKAVIPYFNKFIELWPDIHALAQAESDDVMNNWAGLGYYARARNLHKCAKVVSDEYGGVFPSEHSELKKLPGIGDYTSAAITSIAFDKEACVFDGNVERVMARFHQYEGFVPKEKAGLKVLAAEYSDGFSSRSGDYAQALMDLGATICTPKKPVCALCPLNDNCRVSVSGVDAELYPRKAKKGKKQRRYGYVYWIANDTGQVLIEKRPDKGLLGGMYGLPTSEWLISDGQYPLHIPYIGKRPAEDTGLRVEHVFTHFHLTLKLMRLSSNESIDSSYKWEDISSFGSDVQFPTVFSKAHKLFI